MRVCVTSGICLATVLALCGAASAQQTSRERSPDRNAPADARKREAGRTEAAGRTEDDGPSPGKAQPRAKTDAPRAGSPDGGGPRGFGGGFGGRGGSGGGGGFGGGFGGPRFVPAGPGMPGPGGGYGVMPPEDPEMRALMDQDAVLDRETHEIADRVREMRGDDRNKLKTQLSDLVNKHFDIRQKRRELQLKRMEDELKRLREAIAKRNESRESIVDTHIRELVGEPRDVDF